jgi:dTDP-4-amino-4,6-dideoxygalactose transaminase
LIVDFDCYRVDYANYALPIARGIAANILTLPLYGSLSEEDIDFICAEIAGMAVPSSIR